MMIHVIRITHFDRAICGEYHENHTSSHIFTYSKVLKCCSDTLLPDTEHYLLSEPVEVSTNVRESSFVGT